MSVQLAQTRRAFSRELDSKVSAGYRSPSPRNGAEADWRAAYERERIRLAKLLVLYRDQEEELRTLRERLNEAEARPTTIETPPVAPPRAARHRRSRRARPGPFELNGYRLYRARVERRGGGLRDLFFFSKRTPKRGRRTSIPKGFEVRTTRSGLPVLKRSQAARGPKARVRRSPPAATRARPGKKQPPGSRGLTERQRRALAYAREMRGLRARARRARGGKGPIASRRAAQRLRVRYGYA